MDPRTVFQSRLQGVRSRISQHPWRTARTSRAYVIPAVILVLLLGVGIGGYLFLLPPPHFPTHQVISIPGDASVGDMAHQLADAGVIRSPLLFKLYARATFQDRALSSGLYQFDHPIGLAVVVSRLANGRHGITPARLTFTEGMTTREITAKLQEDIPNFDTQAFLDMASTSEGYLFPDTYFFLPNVTPDEVFTRLRARFDERIATINEQLTASKRSTDDIVTMASILEREAKTPEDMRIVAGILWKRLDAGMPLQVDAPFGYVHGVSGYTPTQADLEHDSPYNTYLNQGLPPTAIGNPGLDALLAAAEPTKTAYLYYLTGTDGQMHYARTFEDHKKNRALYLR